jgi:hypothetical protein
MSNTITCERIRAFFRCLLPSECCSENKKEEVIEIAIPVIITPIIVAPKGEGVPKAHSYPKLPKDDHMLGLMHHIPLSDNRVVSVLPQISRNPQLPL